MPVMFPLIFILFQLVGCQAGKTNEKGSVKNEKPETKYNRMLFEKLDNACRLANGAEGRKALPKEFCPCFVKGIAYDKQIPEKFKVDFSHSFSVNMARLLGFKSPPKGQEKLFLRIAEVHLKKCL